MDVKKTIYRKVATEIWGDKKFKALSNDAKLAFLFILTHPYQTSLGAMRHSFEGLTKELAGVDTKAFAELLSAGMVKYDDDACFIWLPNFLEYNKPDNPNVVKSWGRPLGLLPECELKSKLISHVITFLKGFSEPFQKGLPDCFGNGMAIQEQEQEQEQEVADTKPPVSASKKKNGKHWENNLGSWFKQIKEKRDTLMEYYPQNQVNIDAFIQQKLNIKGHPEAIEKSLYGLLRVLESDEPIKIGKPWGYMEKIFSIENGNSNERDGMAIHEKLKQMNVLDSPVADILKKIGG